MRFAGILMISVLLQLSLSGQSPTLTFSGKNIPFKEILAIIKSQTGVLFFYDASLIADAKPSTIRWKNVTLETALNEIFKDQPLSWVMEDKSVAIIKRQAQITSPAEVATQHPAPIRVRGSIIDREGNPASEVSVIIKGTKRGTISDEAGKFSLQAGENNTLVFSSVNYRTAEVKVEKVEMNIKLELDVKPMEALIVGGNLNTMKRRADPTSVTVLDSKTLERIPENTLDQVFRGWVTGTNSFDIGDSPGGFPALTIRGASSANSPSIIAVYIDGIEYAGGSGYLSQMDKSNIDRIEIVKGPGAATMYGTGSNGGIVQIFTKKGRAGQSSLNLTSGAGFYKSKWVKNNPFQQMHSIETITSLKNVAITLGGTYRTIGAYLPDGGEKNKGFYASARSNVGKLQASLSTRYNGGNFSLSRGPYYDTATHPRTDLIIEPIPGTRTPAYLWFNVSPTPSRHKNAITETYITAINLSHRTTSNWVNNLDAGYTINDSRQVPNQDGAPLQRQYSSEKYSITTIRYSNVLNLYNNDNGLAAAITTGAEYKKYSYTQAFTRATAATTILLKEPDNENYGAFVQVNPSFKEVYLTLGMRYEKNKLFKAAWNPRIGLTTNFDIHSITIKPRISWGKGITSPSYEHRFGQPRNNVVIIYANPDIKPQSQQGFDYGAEIYHKQGKYKFEVVYYDNVLKDMIAEESLGPDPGDSNLSGFIYTNVCKVANRGWEFSGEVELGRFTFQGTFSSMNTTIKDSTGGHILPSLNSPPGTRLPNLPKHTAVFSLTYEFVKLFQKADKGAISLNVTEMDGIKSSDLRRYLLDVAYGRIPYTPAVSGYPVVSSPLFRVGLYADYHITGGLRFFIQGSNILNDYKYEYSDNNLTHGATWLFGLKYNFFRSN